MVARMIDRGLWEQWRVRVRRSESWDGTVEEFCRREGVSHAAFYQWRKKLRSEAGAGTESHRPPAFVPVVAQSRDVMPRPLESASVVVVTLASGTRVEIPAAAGALVERVVLALDGLAGEGRS